MGKKNRTNRENKSPTGNAVHGSCMWLVHFISYGTAHRAWEAVVSEKQRAGHTWCQVCAVPRGPIEFCLLAFRIQE
jgi:hypothetical protein